MIRISLTRLMNRYKQESGKKISIQDIHEATKVHRKILSKMVNHPEKSISSEHVNAVAQFFFKKLRDVPKQKLKDRLLMQSIILDLVDIFPEDPKYWKEIKKAMPEYEKASDVPSEVLWALYEKRGTK